MPPAATSASGSIRTWRAVAATPAQWRRTRSVNTSRQATVLAMIRLITVFALLALVAGCGSETAAKPAAAPVTIALDFVPNPVHAPIYMARPGALEIRKPG